MNTCLHINRVLSFAEAYGNTVLNVSSYKQKKIVWMNDALQSTLREKIQSDNLNKLEYVRDEDAPHDPGTECFICNKCKVVIVFPLVTAR